MLEEIGREIVKLNIVIAIVSTLLAVLLASTGVGVPDFLQYTMFDINAAIQQLNALSGNPWLVLAQGMWLAGIAALNIMVGTVTALGKLVYAALASIDPSLTPAAMFLGSFFSAMAMYYIVVYTWRTIRGG